MAAPESRTQRFEPMKKATGALWRDEAEAEGMWAQDLQLDFGQLSGLQSGTHGKVSAAVRRADGLAVAIKMSGVGEEWRLAIEVTRGLQCRHVNLVQVLASGHVNGVPAMVMALAPWGDLFTAVSEAQSCTPVTMEMLDGMLAGLEFLHSKLCVVHGDIKAENVLLGPDMRPMWCDIGHVRLGQSLEYAAATPETMSPEHWAGSSILAHASQDMWGFGVCIYNCLFRVGLWKVPETTDPFFQDFYAVFRHPTELLKSPPAWSRMTPNWLAMVLMVLQPTRPLARASATELRAHLRHHDTSLRHDLEIIKTLQARRWAAEGNWS